MLTAFKDQKHLTALITGASSGLGESIAMNLAGRGHDLILVSENEGELKRVRNRIKSKYQVSVKVMVADLFHTESADRIYLYCERNALKVDILANCAGIYPTIEREMSDIFIVGNAIDLHVRSLTKLCFYFGTAMVRRKFGFILNISSIAAEFPDPASMTYGPTKQYILSLSEALHCEWKPSNVRVTCATPGGLDTGFFTANQVFIPAIIRRSLLSPDICAEKSIRALYKGKVRVTPGIAGKVQSFFLKRIVRPATYPIIKRIYFYMKNR
jgi:uncharacterized protein